MERRTYPISVVIFRFLVPICSFTWFEDRLVVESVKLRSQPWVVFGFLENLRVLSESGRWAAIKVTLGEESLLKVCRRKEVGGGKREVAKGRGKGQGERKCITSIYIRTFTEQVGFKEKRPVKSAICGQIYTEPWSCRLPISKLGGEL